ncbi:SGNH/GDSL hydrolase family protein [Paenibacillus alba]|uniref:SGNH/GDSL hydrolase family protein n=1 Tax=Paenibacillus alba TaxID=1197127 RepID=UPI001564CCE4|nr:SGNH/GDSL hydrolase family protein [Paenibacillus alba]NQX65170.1 SGNH/GDSL hydrolase family protein [Paenibacillus alba]
MNEPIRIVFLGDSITEDGTFIAYLDAYLQQQRPENRYTLINLGVSSETASGLSEPDHPFLRPCLHHRLARALQQSKPDWVVLGYGMNDGIYAPFSAERFAAYQQGILEAIGRIYDYGAKAIVMTPPPFDHLSIEANALLPEGEKNYSYKTPYEHYNDVLRSYANWILTLDRKADVIVNLYDPLLRHTQQERKKNGDYRSGDGIHPNSDGHWIIAQALLSGLFHLTLAENTDFILRLETSPFFQLIVKRHRVLHDAWKEHVGHTNPTKANALPLETALRRFSEW